MVDYTSLEDVKTRLLEPSPNITSSKETPKENQVREKQDVKTVPTKAESPVLLSTPFTLSDSSSSKYHSPLLLLLMSYVIFSFPVNANVSNHINILARSAVLVLIYTLSERFY